MYLKPSRSRKPLLRIRLERRSNVLGLIMVLSFAVAILMNSVQMLVSFDTVQLDTLLSRMGWQNV